MEINGVKVDDTHAEAFPMKYARLLVTAMDDHWLDAGIVAATGFATSIIGCGVEAGLERKTTDTPDNRPGAYLLFFAKNQKTLEKQLLDRIGQTLLTCPTTTVFNGSTGGTLVDTGAKLRYFGDGHEKSLTENGRIMWQIPVSDGAFLVEESFSIHDGIGGGAFIIAARSAEACINAAKHASETIAPLPGVILPFPGGVCRSASKAGSIYKFLKASTNTQFLPHARGADESKLPKDAVCAYEIVIDGVDESSVTEAMKTGIAAACEEPGVVMISAPNFGGSLGEIELHLLDIMNRRRIRLK